jgi:hypothetical protein
MPIKPCSKNGKSGYKYGNSGKCYTGKGAKAKANGQRKAILAGGYKEK